MTATSTDTLPRGKHFWEDAVDVAIFDARGVRNYGMNRKYWGMNSPTGKNMFWPSDAAVLTKAALSLFQERSASTTGTTSVELDGWEAVTLTLAGYLTKEHFEQATETSEAIKLPHVDIEGTVRRITIVAYRVQLFDVCRNLHRSQ